jgi:hypothetical protein
VCYEPIHRGRDEIDRVAGAIKATHFDFRYQPIAMPEELGNGERIEWFSELPFIYFSTCHGALDSAVRVEIDTHR